MNGRRRPRGVGHGHVPRLRAAGSGPDRSPPRPPAREVVATERDPSRTVPLPTVEPEPVPTRDGVRPYIVTGGRTRADIALSWETMIWTTWRGASRLVTRGISDEARRAAELCTSPRSVAEVAAMLELPVAVSRIVLSDLARQQFVTVHRPADAVDAAMVHRLLHRLRTL